MATIFRKSDKGRAEVETRAHRLPPRLRTALIMVDGQRSEDELAKLILVQPQQTLAELLAGGFIEAVGQAGAVRASPGPALAAAPAPVEPRTPAPGNPIAFAVWRRDAVRALTETVGPMMSETLALRMERATDAQALRPLLDLARQLIHNTRGPNAAASFAQRFVERA